MFYFRIKYFYLRIAMLVHAYSRSLQFLLQLRQHVILKCYFLILLSYMIYLNFEHKTNDLVSISVIEKLQSWNLLVRYGVLKCKNGHYLKLYTDARSLHRFGWRCRAPIKKTKNKCDYYRSISVDTFFHKSHLSLYQIVSFAILSSG